MANDRSGDGLDRRQLLGLGLAGAAVLAGCRSETQTLLDDRSTGGLDGTAGLDGSARDAAPNQPEAGPGDGSEPDAFAEDAGPPDSGVDPGPPNLVFIFSDQHSFDMFGAAGNRQIITPGLDALAAQSIRFRHCVSIAPVCTPYRGMLMSGQHPLYNGCYTNDIQMLPGNGTYFAEVLRDAGYRMGYVGKWHLYGGYRVRAIPAGPFRYGHDGTFLTNNVHSDFRPQSAFYYDAAGTRRNFGTWEPYGQTDQVEAFLDAQRPGEPFALFTSLHPPHYHSGGTYLAPQELMGLYQRSELELRPTIEDTPENRRDFHGYYALVTMVDQCVQRIMEKLAQRGLDRNTIVVFTADHGDLLNVHGFTGSKARPEDEAARVPLLLRWPERLQPRVSDLLFGTLDFMPTLLSLMGLAPPSSCQGMDLSQAIIDGNDDARDALPMFMYRPLRSWRGIYTRRYTYACEHPKDPTAQYPFDVLYDRDIDPQQRTNLFSDPGSTSLKDDLHARTVELMRGFSDDFAVNFENLTSLCLLRPNLALDDPDATGALRGRPVDVLRANGIIT